MFGTGDISAAAFKDGFSMDGIKIDAKCHDEHPEIFAVRIKHPKNIQLVIHSSDTVTTYIEDGQTMVKVDANPRLWGSIIIGVKGKYDNLAWI